jgi:hypothetical protein
MTKYTLMVSWNATGKTQSDQAPKRRRDALTELLKKKNVYLVALTPMDDGAIWVVDGSAKDVQDLVDVWTGHGRVDVAGRPP